MATKPPARNTLLHLEEGTIASMATNEVFLKEFPFLVGIRSKIKTAVKGCTTCGRAAKERAAIYGAAKAAIAGMDSDKKRRLKDLLNAKEIRIVYRSPGNKLIKLTF